MVERHRPGFRLCLWVSMTAIQPMLDNPPTLFFSESSPLGTAGGPKLGLSGCNLFPVAGLNYRIQNTCILYGWCNRDIVNGIVNDSDNVNDMENPKDIIFASHMYVSDCQQPTSTFTFSRSSISVGIEKW